MEFSVKELLFNWYWILGPNKGSGGGEHDNSGTTNQEAGLPDGRENYSKVQGSKLEILKTRKLEFKGSENQGNWKTMEFGIKGIGNQGNWKLTEFGIKGIGNQGNLKLTELEI